MLSQVVECKKTTAHMRKNPVYDYPQAHTVAPCNPLLKVLIRPNPAVYFVVIGNAVAVRVRLKDRTYINSITAQLFCMLCPLH